MFQDSVKFVHSFAVIGEMLNDAVANDIIPHIAWAINIA
jgi:hypothetical protein